MLERFLTRPVLQLAALPFLVWNTAIYVSWIAFPFTGLLLDGRPIGIDFQVFWTAARVALAGTPALVYEPLVMYQAKELLIPGVVAPSPWLYPPSFLLMVLPLGLLPYFVALAVFMLSTVLGLVWVWRRTAPGGAGAFLLLASPAVFWALVFGQNTFLTAALFGVGLMLLPTRATLAGIAFGLLTIKPQFGLMIPLVLIAQRQWRCLASAAVTALLLLGVSLLVVGPRTLTAFLDVMPVYSDWMATNEGMHKLNTSLFSAARMAGLSISAAYAVHGAVVILVLLAVLRVWTMTATHAIRCAVLGLGTMLVSPYLLYYDLVWSLLPLAWFAAHACEQGWRRGDRIWLLLVWLTPHFSWQSRELVGGHFAPLVLLGFFFWLVWRASAIDLRPSRCAPEPAPAAGL
jgi:hypothetical protein